MSRSQREKGAAGEREAAAFLTDLFGVKFERLARNGVAGGHDVACAEPNHLLRHLHVEVKRNQSMTVDAMLRQAHRDSRGDRLPIVVWRRNREEWRIAVEAKLLPWLAKLVSGSGVEATIARSGVTL